MTTQQINTKVCIIGAGLAGLIIANILHKYEISCIVIEKYSPTEIYARSRPSLIDSQTVAILQNHGLSDRLLRVAKPQGKCEFRTPEQSFLLDYAYLSDGQTRYLCSQQELLADLIYQYQQAGGQILFNTQGITISNERHGAKVECRQGIHDVIIKSDFIAGCDGFNGVSRSSIPKSVTQPQGINYNYAWLAITAEALPSTEHIIYGIHPHGFAGHMLLSATVSYYYLQIPLGDTVDDWSSDRIWSELQLRLAKDHWSLTKGKIIEKQVLELGSFVTQTMQHKSLFLAGDAAHRLTPAGGKGINLAIQDAEALGKSFSSYYRYHDNLPLRNYSATRLPVIRSAQEFSESLLHMINSHGNRPLQDPDMFQLLQKFKLSQLTNSISHAQEFARMYVGYSSNQPIIKPQTQKKYLMPTAPQYRELKPLVVVK